MSHDVLQQLADILIQRKQQAQQEQTTEKPSYVIQLHQKGLNKILEKVGEEATETILAAKEVEHGADKHQLIYETADLWFHSLIMLSHLDISYTEILNELTRRFGISGIEEKAARQ